MTHPMRGQYPKFMKSLCKLTIKTWAGGLKGHCLQTLLPVSMHRRHIGCWQGETCRSPVSGFLCRLGGLQGVGGKAGGRSAGLPWREATAEMGMQAFPSH